MKTNSLILLLFLLFIGQDFAIAKPRVKNTCPKKVYIPNDSHARHKCPKPKNIKNAKYY